MSTEHVPGSVQYVRVQVGVVPFQRASASGLIIVAPFGYDPPGVSTIIYVLFITCDRSERQVLSARP